MPEEEEEEEEQQLLDASYSSRLGSKVTHGISPTTRPLVSVAALQKRCFVSLQVLLRLSQACLGEKRPVFWKK